MALNWVTVKDEEISPVPNITAGFWRQISGLGKLWKDLGKKGPWMKKVQKGLGLQKGLGSRRIVQEDKLEITWHILVMNLFLLFLFYFIFHLSLNFSLFSFIFSWFYCPKKFFKTLTPLKHTHLPYWVWIHTPIWQCSA